jgi:hypothetical protein
MLTPSESRHSENHSATRTRSPFATPWNDLAFFRVLCHFDVSPSAPENTTALQGSVCPKGLMHVLVQPEGCNGSVQGPRAPSWPQHLLLGDLGSSRKEPTVLFIREGVKPKEGIRLLLLRSLTLHASAVSPVMGLKAG